MRNQKTRKKLGELITNAGKERPICKKSCKEKAVTLGRVHYYEDGKKYFAVRLPNGGGKRKHYFPIITRVRGQYRQSRYLRGVIG